MNTRPLSITVLSCVFAAAGAIGLAYHLIEFKAQHPFHYDIVWVSLVRLAAIVCGVFMLRGSNWARWLTLVWIAFHVVLSAFHSLQELVVHGLLFAVFTYFLFRPQATEYFHARRKVTI
jgi:predicted cobalt transporter CbtA